MWVWQFFPRIDSCQDGRKCYICRQPLWFVNWCIGLCIMCLLEQDSEVDGLVRDLASAFQIDPLEELGQVLEDSLQSLETEDVKSWWQNRLRLDAKLQVCSSLFHILWRDASRSFDLLCYYYNYYNLILILSPFLLGYCLDVFSTSCKISMNLSRHPLYLFIIIIPLWNDKPICLYHFRQKILNKIENKWLGCWKGILLGSREDQAEEDWLAKYANEFCELFYLRYNIHLPNDYIKVSCSLFSDVYHVTRHW